MTRAIPSNEQARPHHVRTMSGQDQRPDGAESLVAEWLALPDLSANLTRRLADLGVGREAIRRAGSIGASRIHGIGRAFTPAGYGRLHLVLPVWAGPAPSIFEAVERPVLLDLLAWHPDNPVELNALASDQFVKWIETKLDEQGVTKVIPNDDTLAEAFKNWCEQAVVRARLKEVLAELKKAAGGGDEWSVPHDLRDQVERRLALDRALTWDAAIHDISEAVDLKDDGEEGSV